MKYQYPYILHKSEENPPITYTVEKHTFQGNFNFCISDSYGVYVVIIQMIALKDKAIAAYFPTPFVSSIRQVDSFTFRGN